MPRDADDRRRRIRLTLTIIFVVALVMGPGPGMRLVDPGPEHAGPTPTFLGLPALYAWGILWFGVQAAVIVVAYLRLWPEEDS